MRRTRGRTARPTTAWSSACACGGTTRCCSTCTRRPPSGATRSCRGPVRPLCPCCPLGRSLPELLRLTSRLSLLALLPAGDKNDAFWLAQIHFLTAHYSRALRILLSPLRPGRPPRAFAPLSPGAGGPNGWGKGKSRAMAAAADDDDDGDESGSDGEGEWGGPARAGEGAWAHGLSGGQTDWATGAGEPGARRMVDISLACRYLAGQCQVRRAASTLSLLLGVLLTRLRGFVPRRRRSAWARSRTRSRRSARPTHSQRRRTRRPSCRPTAASSSRRPCASCGGRSTSGSARPSAQSRRSSRPSRSTSGATTRSRRSSGAR